MVAALACASALVLALASGSAKAFCASAPYSNYIQVVDIDPIIELPVDAQPWQWIFCGERGEVHDVETGEPFDCELVASDQSRVALELDAGPDGWSADDCVGNLSEEYYEFAYVRYIPERELTPGETYTLRCDSLPFPNPITQYTGAGDAELQLLIRDSPEPSLAPPALDVKVTLSHTSVCGAPTRELEIRLTGFDRAFLDEGGVIEVRDPSGATYEANLGNLDSANDSDEFELLALPLLNDDLTFTSIAANGDRGEPVTVAREDFGNDLVYTPCHFTVAPSSARAPLWFLVPLLLLTRRRRRA